MSGNTMRYTVETEFLLVDHFSIQLDKLGFADNLLNKTLGVSLLKAQQRWEALGQKIAQVSAVIGTAAVGAAINASKKYIEFEDVVTKAGSKFVDLDVTSGTFLDDLDALSEAAQQVGAVTKYTASDAAGVLDKMAMGCIIFRK